MSKISNEVERFDNFRALAKKNYHFFFPTEIDIFRCTTTLCTYSIYRSASHLLSFIISNTAKREFSSV